MATVPYKQLLNPSDNLIALLQEQNTSGAEFGQLKGWEPFEVLVTKALFNAANTGGSLGEVSSVNGLTGVVVLDKSDIGLGNVPNTDATNASNLGSGIIPDARMPNLTGDVTTVEGAVATTLATVNSNVGTFGDSTHVAAVTVNAKGLVTAVSSVAISGGGGSGDVTGPVTSTNTALAKWSGTAGDTLADTGVLVDASNNITGVNNLTADVVSAPAIAISATHGTDDTYHGITITGLNSGATVAQWEAVYLGASSTWLLADANGSGTYPARGLAVAAYVDTNAATILIQGTARNDAWAWTPGGTIYLSATAGGLTQTAPATSGDKVQQVGFALTADIAFFNFASGEYATVT